MIFNLNQERHDSIKETVINFFRPKQVRKKGEFKALSDINFKLYPGDRVGVLGLNGAGKSTLLKAIAGVYKPTVGSVKRRGKVAPLLELGAGFNMEFTGIENIYLNGTMRGFSEEEIDAKLQDILDFADDVFEKTHSLLTAPHKYRFRHHIEAAVLTFSAECLDFFNRVLLIVIGCDA